MMFLSLSERRQAHLALASTILLTALVSDLANFGKIMTWLWGDDTTSSSKKKKAGPFGCRNQAYTKGHWVVNDDNDGYKWLVDDPDNCQLEKFSRQGFCEALGGRSLLLVGDSLTQGAHMYMTNFMNISNVTMLTDAEHYRKPQHVELHCAICGEDSPSVLSYLRNDHLTMHGDEVDRDLSEHRPWIDIIDQYDFLILNQGAHTMKNYQFEARIQNVILTLQENYTGTVFWRTTPRGHINCSNDDIPIFGGEEDPNYDRFFVNPPPKFKRYNYGQFPQQNAILYDLINNHNNKSAATNNNQQGILDVARITEMRPDGHKEPPRDCLHYFHTETGAYQSWWWLTQNALRGYL